MHFNQEKAKLLVSHIKKSYEEQEVIKDLSFSVNAGESLSIIGPSGCGKSTLLYLLSGLDSPDNPETGKVLFLSPQAHSSNQAKQEQSSQSFFSKHSRNPRISYVMQDYGLFAWKTAEENLALPLILYKFPKATQKELIENMLLELGLQGINKKYPFELSGGQRQRLALGRSLISSPEILLLDEPMSSVDAITREILQKLILQLWQKYHFTFILVTHSVAEAIYLGKNIMVMEKVRNQASSQTSILENPCFGLEDAQKTSEYPSLYTELSHKLAHVY